MESENWRTGSTINFEDPLARVLGVDRNGQL